MRLLVILGYHPKELGMGLAVRDHFLNKHYDRGRKVFFYVVKNPDHTGGSSPQSETAKEIRQLLTENTDIEGLIDLHFGGGETIEDMDYIGDGTLIRGPYYDMDLQTAKRLARKWNDDIFLMAPEVDEKYGGTPTNRRVPAVLFEAMLSTQSRNEGNQYCQSLLEKCSQDIASFYDFLSELLSTKPRSR